MTRPLLTALVVWLAGTAAAGQPDPQRLEARRPHVEVPLSIPPVPSGAPSIAGLESRYRLVVKFRDDVRARAAADGLTSQGGADLEPIRRLAAGLALRFDPLIRLPAARLEDLEQRAAARSKRAQPDLQGIMAVSLSEAGLDEMVAAGNALQAEDAVEYAYLQVLAVPPPVDIPPQTPDLVAYQNYRGPNPGLNFDYAWSFGLRGAGIRFSDAEYSWRQSHEDLRDVDLHLEPGQTPYPIFTDDHGTAVTSMTSSPHNGYGVSGLVPEAEVHTYPEYTYEGGSRRVAAVASAIADSDAGDVVLLEMQYGPFGPYGPAELDRAVWDVVRTGTDAGVIVVAAAGNGAADLDGPEYGEYRGRGDSGAIIVGAGSADTRHDRLSFSTFGSRVDVQGWGTAVFTAGYGAFATYGGDFDQTYTQAFGGTSSASPMVAAACVALQQLAVSRRGWPLSPHDLRSLLILTGRPQGSGGHIGPFPNMQRAIQEFLGASVTLTAETLTVGETAGGAVVGIRVLTNYGQPTATPITVSYTTVNGTAVAGADYTATGGSHTFPAGTTNGAVLPVSVPISNDVLDEDAETFRFDLTSVTGAIMGIPASSTVTIADDDPLPEVFASSVSVTELDTGQNVQAMFNLGLSALSGRPVTVSFTTVNRDATAGSDYVAVTDARTFTPGTINMTVPVTVLGDVLDEDDEQFSFLLSGAVNATVRTGDWRGTIVDNDPLPTLSTQDQSLLEGDTGSQAMNFPLTLNTPSGRRAWVRFQTEDLTAQAGRDYVAQDTPYVIEPGQTVLNVPVTVLGDRIHEPGGETFRVKLAAPVNALVAAPGHWRGTILDNDPVPAASVSDCTRVEGNGDAVPCPFAVTLSNPSTQPISVGYATGPNPAGQTDYQPASGTLNFAPETTLQTVNVAINADVEPEWNEQFLLNLTGASNATIADGQGVGTIIDDEKSLFRPVAPCRVLDTRPSSPVEAGQARTFSIAGLCGVPFTAKAVAVNVTAVQQGAAGNLRLFPAALPVPGTSVLNFAAQTPRANNATVLLGTAGQVTVLADMAAGAQAHVIVDVFGYYETDRETSWTSNPPFGETSHHSDRRSGARAAAQP